MKMKLLVFAAGLILFLSGYALPLLAEEGRIVVSATGKVSVKPDMAEFAVVVKSDALNADKAAADTAEKYNMVQKALRTAGIPSDDASTSSYTISPRWEWEPSLNKNVLKGYSARHTLSLKVRSLGSIGKVIDAVVKAGADEVQNIIYSSSRYDELRQKALAIAVGNARRDGVIMASAAGGRLGQLIEISFGQQAFKERPFMEGIALRASPAPAQTEITAADQDISVTINSRWRFITSAAK
jgi:uncharacterized protein YggE